MAPSLPTVWRGSLAVLALVWVLIGLWALTMPLAFLIWALLGFVVVFGLFFGGERFIKYGKGEL